MSDSTTLKANPWLRWLPVNFRRGKAVDALIFSLLLILILLAFMVFGPSGDMYALHLPLLAVLLGLALGVHLGMNVERAVDVGTACTLVLMSLFVWRHGGLASPRAVWLLMLPLIPFYIRGRRAGLCWVAAVFVVQMAMTAFPATPAADLAADDALRVFHPWLTFTALAILFILGPLVYQHLNQRTLQLHRRELQKQRQALERTLVMRKDFLATVSHELRTPMNAILGFNTWLRSQVQGKPEALRALQHTCNAAEHLMTVINDTLDYSELQDGQMATHPAVFELRPAVTHAFELLSSRTMGTAVDCQLVWDEQLPLWVHGDRHRLAQVLVNLLGNALKFTAQGHVQLHASVHAQGVMFAVQDTGIGIAPDKHAHIFQRFVQADKDIQARFGGHGLGLAISKKLVELMGGRIGFDSTPGQGSRFWFVLPLQAHPAPERISGTDVQRSEMATADRAWRILIVDDHPINRVLAKKVLHTAWPHAQMDEAADGQQCLAKMAQHSFDLVLMDMVMPVMDGIEATRVLRQNPAWQNVPVLGLTANVNPVDLESFGASGLSDVMLKPFEPAQLCALIEQLMLRQPADG